MGQPAARVGDFHTCPLKDGKKPHVGGPILPAGCPTVLIGGQAAARLGDMAACQSPAIDAVAEGEATVLIGGQPAARLGDKTAHGGVIAAGCATVLIGNAAQGECLKSAAQAGKPFVEMAG